MTLTIILTTIGRVTLPRTLASLAQQDWQPGDEVLVVSDDKHQAVAHTLTHYQGPFRQLPLTTGPHHDWGHTPRNWTLPHCQSTHIGHFDDDDVMLPGAISQIRLAILVDPQAVHLFRFLRYQDLKRVWTDPPRLAVNHVGTPNIVHPNRPELLGRWQPRIGGDGDFIIETCQRVGRHHWQPAVTCVVGPPRELGLKEVVAWVRGLCPTGNLHPKRSYLAHLLDNRFQRPPWQAPAGCGVLAATDDGCFPGLQLLYHSLQGRCPLAVVDLGLSPRQANWLRSRAIVLLPRGPFHLGHQAWQTWNKPWYFTHRPFPYTLWLDCDTVVVGSLLPLFQQLILKPLLTPHWDGAAYAGDIGPAVPTPIHPLPKGLSVNAGVVGLSLPRDEDFLHQWQHICLLAAREPQVAQDLPWYDESALHWALRQLACWEVVASQQGWNQLSYVKPSLKRRGPPLSAEEFLLALPVKPGDEVIHYSIKDKPWRYWAKPAHLWE